LGFDNGRTTSASSKQLSVAKSHISSSSASTSSSSSSQAECWKCGQRGHYANACQSATSTASKGTSPQIKQLKVENAADLNLSEGPEPDLLDAAKILGITVPTAFQSDNIITPITIANKPILAQVDSGANRSCINLELTKELGLVVHPASGNIHLASANCTISRTGMVNEVEVKCGARTVQHSFEVLVLSSDTPVLLGRDIFSKLGIAIHGLPIHFPSEETINPNSDKSPMLETIGALWSPRDQLSADL
jgi:hypothetical protein